MMLWLGGGRWIHTDVTLIIDAGIHRWITGCQVQGFEAVLCLKCCRKLQHTVCQTPQYKII